MHSKQDIDMRRTRTIKRGKHFFAAGWGKYGPFAVYTRRLRKRTYAKTSVGLKGVLAGLKYSGRRVSAQGMVNLISGKPSVSISRKSRRRRRRRKRY